MEYTVIGNIILLKFHPEIQPVEKLTGFRFDNRAKSDTINGVNTLLQVVQKNEDYFGTIDYRYDSEQNGTIIKIWDNTYDKPMTDVIVIIQQNYSIEKEMENPSLISLQKPKEGKYHATLSFMPEGKYAQELGGVEYFAKGVNLESITSPTRIFAYYSLGDLEIPSKFITEELNVQH